MNNLTDKFIKGLQNYNLTQKDIKNQNFKYCGGNEGRHNNYFKIFFKKKLEENPRWIPEFKEECVCGHKIKENCYIINDSNIILTLGNCCIKKFVPKSGRTCEVCQSPHKNRIVNRCNECRVGICDKCDKECSRKYSLCWKCNFANITGRTYISDSENESENENENESESELKIHKDINNNEIEKIIKFGKYKNETYKNISVKDKDYLIWLLNQEWFKDKEYVKSLYK